VPNPVNSYCCHGHLGTNDISVTMTLLEGSIILILLLLAMPGVCRRMGRPGLLYPAYIIAGALAGVAIPENVTEVWRQLGQLGFILLLFSVGLEIELPERRNSFIALRRALFWMLAQIVVIGGGLVLLGIRPLEASVAATALSSTSVGMSFVLWSHHRFASQRSAKAFLEWLVAIEVISMLFFASVGPVLEGVPWWLALLRFCGLLLAAGLAVWAALRIVPRFAEKISQGLKIEVPLLILFLFVICAIGDRLGLSAPKTAFVLGLFVSRSTDAEVALNHRLEPLRDHMFVPVFFFGLGTLLRIETVWNWQFAMAIVAGLLFYGLRYLLYGAFFAKAFETKPQAHSIAAPMLTLAAVAIEVMVQAKASPQLVSWTLASSLSLSLFAAFRGHTPDHLLVEYETSMISPGALEILNKGKEK
jgi:Kef-type K+ transport system membrane component KefB